METMISVERARELMQLCVKRVTPSRVHLLEAAGLVLAENLYASRDVPSFRQSNMDGYALHFQPGCKEYPLMGEIVAGADTATAISPGTATRIFTGAPVPDGANTVVMQEKTRVIDNSLILTDDTIQSGDHVRLPGVDIKKGSLLLQQGTLLHPPSIGMLASMGIEYLSVFPNPSVGILVTGNEIVTPGADTGPYQLYDSNSFVLRALLKQLHIEKVQVAYAKDNLLSITEQLAKLMQDNDWVLITGGVSVGDYDFTLRAIEQCGIVPVFHKIRQKPGKPLLLAQKGNQLVWGLPGNPASVITCFYEYILQAHALATLQPTSLRTSTAVVTHAFTKSAGLTQFVRANCVGDNLTILSAQESYKLSPYSDANCLAVLPESSTEFLPGTRVTIHLLPS